MTTPFGDKMPTRENWIYLAGLFDGEGTICFGHKYTKAGNISLNGRVVIVMTDKNIIQWLRDTFSEYCGEDKIEAVRYSKNYKHAVAYQFVVLTKKHKKFLKHILPFLRVKHYQAELLLRYRDLVEARSSDTRRWIKEVDDEREYLFNELCNANRRGPKSNKVSGLV